MPIPFTCPHCGLQTNVSDEFAGKSGPCAGCGQTITVPPLAEAVAYTPPAKQSGAPVVLIVVLVLLVLMFLTCGGIFFAGLWSAVPGAPDTML